jgi:hypothetical protein
MIPYSHILHIPKVRPYDGANRWTTFLGEFVKSIVDGRDFSYWFTYYGDFARFRVYTEDESVLSEIVDRAAKLGFRHEIEKTAGHDLTLEEDLGCGRFLGAERTDLKPLDRALKVLNLVHAGAELFLHSLIRDGDYWREEHNQDLNQNPYGSSSRSYIHLLHNIAQSDIQMVQFVDSKENRGLMSEYHFSHVAAAGRLHPPVQIHKIRVTV